MKEESSLKILVADDHALFRSGLKEILTSCAKSVSIDEAATGPEVIKRFGETSYDCVLLDLCMPGPHGIEVVKQLKTINPKTKILVLSMYPEEQYGVRALRAGASGYLTKDVSPEILRSAIQKICRGHKYLTEGLADKMGDSPVSSDTKLPHERLSDRELQVLTMMASGKTVSKIAKELCLSVKTVSTHRAHILAKMGLSNNSELIQYAINNGLVF